MDNKIVIPSGFKITGPVPTDDRSIVENYSELESMCLKCPIGFLITVTSDDNSGKNGVYRRIKEDPYWEKISNENDVTESINDLKKSLEVIDLGDLSSYGG